MSTTALPPNLSPAYQPRSFRGASPYPAPPQTSSSSKGRSVSAHRLEHPLPSRPTTALPSLTGPARLNAEPISGGAATPSLGVANGHRLPPSPAMGAFDERRGRSSGLRHEVKRSSEGGAGTKDRRDSGGKEEGELEEVSPEAKRAAQEVLKLFSKLPAPLPEFLPTTYIPEAAKKKVVHEGSFTEYIRSQRGSSSSASSSSSPQSQTHSLGESQGSLGKRRRSSSPSNSTRTPNPAVGLGLGLEMPPIPKKSKSTNHIGSAAMTPSASLPPSANGRGPRSPELLRTASTGNVMANGRASTPTRESGYRPRTGSSAKGSPPHASESKATWNRAKWGEAAIGYRDRAIKLKRQGDARMRVPSAKAEYLHLPQDQLLGLLCLTDAMLLFLYSYWAEEQSIGRVRGTPYSESQPLRDFIRDQWDRFGRTLRDDQEREREMVKGMIGLMFLMEAVINHHLATETIVALGHRGSQLAAASTSATSGSASTSMNRGGNTSTQTGVNGIGPSPSSTNDASPPNSLVNPSPHSSSSALSPELPVDITNMISQTATQSARASQHLLNARHHLPLSRLRKWYSDTYEAAINSELSDEALPAPNDSLGAARKVDIDALHNFIWPIELGMCAPLAHLSVFGRRLVSEFAEAMGKEWTVKPAA